MVAKRVLYLLLLLITLSFSVQAFQFGYNSTGTSEAAPEFAVANIGIEDTYVAQGNEVVTNISIYTRAIHGVTYNVGIYNMTNVTGIWLPDSVTCAPGNITILGSPGSSWMNSNVSCPLSAGQRYTLALGDTNKPADWRLGFTYGGSTQYRSGNKNISLSSKWKNSGTSSGRYSIYASYIITNTTNTTNPIIQPSLLVKLLDPKTDATFPKNSVSNFTVNLCCLNADCGEVQASLDPQTYYNSILNGPDLTEDTWMGTEGGADCWCSDVTNFFTCSLNMYGMTDEGYYVGINFGGLPTLYNGIEDDSGGAHKQTILLRFWPDKVVSPSIISNGIEMKLVVDNATIRLTHRKSSLDTGQLTDFQYNVSMYEVLRQWVEGEGTSAVSGCPSPTSKFTNWTTNKYVIFSSEAWGNYGSRGRDPASQLGVDRGEKILDSHIINATTVNVNDCFGSSTINNCTIVYWNLPFDLVEKWIKDPLHNFGVLFSPTQLNPESHGSEENWFSSERSEWSDITQPQLILTYHYEPTNSTSSNSTNTSTEKGLIPKGSGIPFYTINNNPQLINLNSSECVNITWEINATGEINASYMFFVFANLTNNLTVSNISNLVNITIGADNTTVPNGSIFHQILFKIFGDYNISLTSFFWNNTSQQINNENITQFSINIANVSSGRYNFCGEIVVS